MTLLDKSNLPPFYDIISRYYNSYDLGDAENQSVNSGCQNVLNHLSSLAEVVLQSELDAFRKAGGDDYDKFVNRILLTFGNDYPVLENSLSGIAKSHYQSLINIDTRLKKDWDNIAVFFKLDSTTNLYAGVDLASNLGDNHNGEGVGLLQFSNGTKLVYKPRNGGVSSAYNYFISWVNNKLDIGLKTFKVLDCGDYCWLEFINNEKVDSQNDLAEYYYKAGILLACTLLLGSKDCHQENVITASKDPVIIDHETITQPHFTDSYGYSWENSYDIPPFSVLESSLIMNTNTGIPLNCVGYGINNYLEFTNVEAQIVKANTIHSQRIPRFVNKKIVEKNVPISDGKYVFANKFKDNFVDGFTNAYDMFLNSKAELLSDSSPVRIFKDKIVRYVWRPTFVYHKILKYLRNPAFVTSFNAYESKLYELLSKAYKSDSKESYRFILDYEMKQMLSGDIPIFHLYSQDNFLDISSKIKIFKYSCLENINHRINLLSVNHKNEQLKYINRWLDL